MSMLLTLGDRVYTLVPFLEGNEVSVLGDEMVERAKRLNANLGEDDAQWILNHQEEIPAELRGNITLVFTAWRNSSDPRYVTYLHYNNGQWIAYLRKLDYPWHGYDLLVQRTK